MVEEEEAEAEEEAEDDVGKGLVERRSARRSGIEGGLAAKLNKNGGGMEDIRAPREGGSGGRKEKRGGGGGGEWRVEGEGGGQRVGA